ncbi:MAG: glutamine synthetase [Rhizobiaceae bacterium MnEN-MB40S]|nr:MAG: glutamine synthetase [Rhizobiaceae bacterium MnEN-MB40S]
MDQIRTLGAGQPATRRPSDEQIAAAIAWLEAHPEIESLRAAICDLNGVLRGKRITVDQARKALEGKMRMPYSLVGLDIWGEDIVGNPQVYERGDTDGVCEWTGRSILPMRWTSRPTALAPLWLAGESGAPHAGDPRRALAAILDRYDALGLVPVVATELEFYLVDPTTDRPAGPISPATGKRLGSDSALSIDEIDAFEAFIHDVYKASEEHSIPVDSTIAENGVGQFEINFNHHPDALRAADDALFFKRIVRGVARKHGFAATFMAKPYGDRAGNGLHTHFSLLDQEGNNVFDNGGDEGSDMMRHAVGGLLAAMAQSTLIFAPHYNSYRRLRPNSYAPTVAAWGYENRMIAVRIPGGSSKARRIEHRVSGADANPYLALAAILGAALIGIERQIDPGDPVEGDAARRELPSLPVDWTSSIDAFENGSIMADLFDPVLCNALVSCKRQEVNTFLDQVSDFEIETYLEIV